MPFTLTYDHPDIALVKASVSKTFTTRGLVQGREFIVHGVLMDKSTGNALVDSNGDTVENSVVFTPESSEGDVDVLLEFDTTNLAGLDMVVFENLYRIDTVTNLQPDGSDEEIPSTQRLVASHTDINDEGQTISIRVNDLASDQFASLVQTGAAIGLGIRVATIAGVGAYQAIKNRHSRR